MTGFVPVMWAAWGVVVILFIAVKIYASRLARDEESQIFLGDSFEQEKSAQAAIVAKVHKMEPVMRAALGLLGAMTAFVVAYYVLDVIKQFKQ